LQVLFPEPAQIRIVGIPRDVLEVVQGGKQVHVSKATDARDEHEVQLLFQMLEQAEELPQHRDEGFRIDVSAQQVGERCIILVD